MAQPNVVSFSNTPQAKDDVFASSLTGLTDASLAIVYLDVMGNDLGGNAKSLWSLDNGSEATTALQQAALLAQDAARAEALSMDRSANGARIWITGDGKVGYDATTLSAAFRDQLDHLPAGQFLTDTFTYAIRLGNGTLSWATATVQIAGVAHVNHPAVIGDPTVHDVTEDVAVNGSGNIVATGTISISDPDPGESAFQTAVTGAAGNLGSLTLASDGTYTYTVDNSAVQYLGAADSKVDTFTITSLDGTQTQVSFTIHGTNDAPSAVADSNAGDVVIEAGVGPGNTPVMGDPSASGNVLANDHDPDVSDHLTVAGVVAGSSAGPVSGNVGSALTGTYGTLTLRTDGGWDYALDNNDSDTNRLAQGQAAADVFTYTTSDGHGGTATATLTVNFTGTNDLPVITGGATSGAVQEDVTLTATGHLNVTDPDIGATQTWSVSGGVSVQPGSYHFSIDDLAIMVNGSPFFHDGFGDGVPPPSGPGITYGVNGTFTETGGRAIMDSTNGTVVTGIGSPDPFLQHSATLLTNIDPNNPTAGLRLANSFNVEARFDLAVPDEDRERYAIRLFDRSIGGPGNPPDQLGDDTIDLSVRRDTDGQVYVQLRVFDFVADTTTTLQSIPLAPPAGANEILLRLHHDANSHIVQASFDYYSVVGSNPPTFLQTQSFSATAPIFNNEDWTRVQIVAGTPQQETSVLDTHYGTPTIDQSGNWTYTLANGRTNVQALAQGQTATDSFTVQVTDDYGATTSRVVTVNVAGTNDAPTITSGPTSRTINEFADHAAGENTATRTATGIITYQDPDLIDVHAVSVTPLGSGYRGTMSVSPIVDTTGGRAGSLTWNYSVSDGALDNLAQGQILTQNYAVTVNDGHGGTAAQNVTIRLVGTNDAPEFSPPGFPTQLTETADTTGSSQPLSAAIPLAFTDVDLNDTAYSAAVTGVQASDTTAGLPDTATLLSFLTVDNVVKNFGSSAGVVNASFSAPDSTFDYLGTGELAFLHYTAQLTEPLAQSSITFMVAIEGRNDAPTISIGPGNSASGLITDTPAATTLTTFGTLTLGDVDLSDGHAVSLPGNGGHGNFGTFTAQLMTDSTGTGTGAISWSYQTDESQIRSLAVNETRTEHFTVQVDDARGGQAFQDVMVTIAGTNEAPTIPNGFGYTFTTLDAPYANPQAFGINNAGEIVGSANNGQSGFLLSNGTYTTLNDPSAGVTIANGINDAGDIVGYTYSGGPSNHGFLLSGGIYTQIDAFGSSTVANGINNAGDIVGFYSNGSSHGFLLSGGSYSLLDDPDGTSTFAYDINASGQIVGTYTDAGGNNHGFLYSAGVYTTIDDPLAGTGPSGNGTHVTGINDSGQIVGHYWDSVGTHGFLYSAGTFVTLDDPLVAYSGFGGTFANAINNAGEIAGRFDGNVTYSFLAVPTGGATGTTTGAFSEQDGVTGSTASDSASGSFPFADVDLADIHLASHDNPDFVWSGGTLDAGQLAALASAGTLDLTQTDSTGTGTGAVDWSYSIDDDALDFLSAGETLTVTHNVTIDDQHGGTATQPVTVTVTGANDAPTISGSNSDALAAWSFDGTGTDISGHGHTVALFGGATYDAGLFGQALSLDGNLGSFAQEPTSSPAFDFGSGDFTIQVWARFDNITNGREETLIEKFTGGGGPGWTFTLQNGNNIQFYAAPAAVLNSGSVPIPNDTWQQFIVERSGDTFSQYWNGNLVATGTSPDALSAAVDPLLIGARDATDGRNFTVDGLIDNVVIWGRALTPAEIAQSWNGGAGVPFGTTSTGAISEQPGVTGSASLDTGSSSFLFADPDLNDTHTITPSGPTFVWSGGLPSGAQLAALSGASALALTVTDSTGTGGGSVDWSFSIADNALDFLGIGQTLTVSYDVTIDDHHGGTVTQPVTVTVTGSNDAPVANDDPTPSTVPPPGSGWVHNTANDHYYRVQTTAVDWSTAQAQAASHGAYLATITSANENAFVTALVDGVSGDGAWLGGSDAAMEGQWVWQTGPEAGALFGYANWDVFAGHEPNGGTSENVLNIWNNHSGRPGGTWNDSNGGVLFAYVEEWGGRPSDTSTYDTTENGTLDINVLANDTDVDPSAVLSVSGFETTSAYGAAISLNLDGSLHYNPTASSALQALAVGDTIYDTFTYTAQDEHGAVSNVATVTVAVHGVSEWTTIDDPLAAIPYGTQARGITASGDIVGNYNAGVPINHSVHGFRYSGGVFTTLDDPGGGETVPYGVNSSGSEIAGIVGIAFQNHGYYSIGSSYTVLDAPGAAGGTYGHGVNDSGIVVGSYIVPGAIIHGFIYNGTFSTFDNPAAIGGTANSLTNVTNGTDLYGINNAGHMVGTFDDASGTHGFFYDGSSFTTLDAPGATGGTFAYGLNNNDDVVGSFVDAGGTHGFVYDGTTHAYTTLDSPSATAGTLAYGINDAGSIVGQYNNNQGVHGFLLLA